MRRSRVHFPPESYIGFLRDILIPSCLALLPGRLPDHWERVRELGSLHTFPTSHSWTLQTRKRANTSWMNGVKPKSELGCLHTAPIRTALGPLPMIGVITRKFYGFNMHWPSDIMTSGHSNMLRKWKDWNTNWGVVFGRSVIERVGGMKRLVLWCIREVGSSRSMIWKRVGRVSDLVESPYSCSTKAPGFGPMPMPPSSISIWCHRGPRKVWRNPVRGDGYARINQE